MRNVEVELIYDDPMQCVTGTCERRGEVCLVIKYVHMADNITCSCKILTYLQCDVATLLHSCCVSVSGLYWVAGDTRDTHYYTTI